MKSRADLIASLQDSRRQMMALLDQVHLDRKVYPLWTIREILAHICGWDDSLIAMAASLRAGDVPATPAMRGINMYNAETVATREGLDYDHIYREYVETRVRLIELLSEIPEELLFQPSTLPWGAAGSMADAVEIFSEHEIEHAGDVKKLMEG